jgi:hypothetical protein
MRYGFDIFLKGPFVWSKPFLIIWIIESLWRDLLFGTKTFDLVTMTYCRKIVTKFSDFLASNAVFWQLLILYCFGLYATYFRNISNIANKKNVVYSWLHTSRLVFRNIYLWLRLRVTNLARTQTPIFAWNLRTNVSKIQDLRLKMAESFFAI